MSDLGCLKPNQTTMLPAIQIVDPSHELLGFEDEPQRYAHHVSLGKWQQKPNKSAPITFLGEQGFILSNFKGNGGGNALPLVSNTMRSMELLGEVQKKQRKRPLGKWE